MRLDPAAPWSQVKHSITEPLRSLNKSFKELIDTHVNDFIEGEVKMSPYQIHVCPHDV